MKRTNRLGFFYLVCVCFNDLRNRFTKWFVLFLLITKNAYHRKNGSQHARNALIMMPNVRAAFFSRRIFEMAHGSTWCMLWRCTAIPLICKCFSSSNAATFDLENSQWRNVFYEPVFYLYASSVFSHFSVSLHQITGTANEILTDKAVAPDDRPLCIFYSTLVSSQCPVSRN